ncbi:cupin domain-containing protein [Aquimarina sp. 2201CG5-10]|uniref:cupin domain-containing protein n=1 Tax=Aquimarina callyspongiae TaxID=3098150 RepID=UPI002AB47675|nr:cupin domain-containing protein [Aquimarina sp. 2201CG5-10]MDY8137310.1 cupin domain-containing protein [Aquimarina sp. 2201CG5-10]
MKSSYTLIFLIGFLFVSCKKNEIIKTEVVTLAETTKSWNGDPLPKYPDGTPKVTILKITIPAKTKLKLHKHPEINAGVLLKGELTVISEHNDTLHLKEGDPIVELVNTWHYGKNDGTKPAEIIVFYAGVEGTPITIVK